MLVVPSMRKPTKTQFRYAPNASAFIELTYSMTRECFVAQLRGVSDVELVGDCNRKFDPGNPGNEGGQRARNYDPKGHYLQANVSVKSKKCRGVMEFSLTRSGHVRSSDLNDLTQATVSMYFKPPPHGMLLEAWRILRAAAEPCTLYPDKVEEWFIEVVQEVSDSRTTSRDEGGHALATQ